MMTDGEQGSGTDYSWGKHAPGAESAGGTAWAALRSADIKQRLLAALREAGEAGAAIAELAQRAGIERHTAAGYLPQLHAEHPEVGRDTAGVWRWTDAAASAPAVVERPGDIAPGPLGVRPLLRRRPQPLHSDGRFGGGS